MNHYVLNKYITEILGHKIVKNWCGHHKLSLHCLLKLDLPFVIKKRDGDYNVTIRDVSDTHSNFNVALCSATYLYFADTFDDDDFASDEEC